MPSTFGTFVVHKDAEGFHISQNPPKPLGEDDVKRTQYAGPRVIMPELVPDMKKWLDARKREGFSFKDAK